MPKHKDSIRTYRITWREWVAPDTVSRHAYTDELASAEAIAFGLRGRPRMNEVTIYAWNGAAYDEVRV